MTSVSSADEQALPEHALAEHVFVELDFAPQVSDGHVLAAHEPLSQALAEHVFVAEDTVTVEDSPADESAEHAAALQISFSQLAAHSPFEHWPLLEA